MLIEGAYKAIYRRLLALYPSSFRERFEVSMQQTFDDACQDRQGTLGSRFVLATFASVIAGIVREQAIQLWQVCIMKKTLIDPRRAAIISLILCLPFFVSALIALFPIEPLFGVFKGLATEDGQQLNSFGRIMIFGGVLLLPVALLLNLLSMLTRRTVEKRMSFQPRLVNIVLGGVALSAIFLLGS